MGDLLSLLAAVCWSAANVTIARGAGGKGDDNGAFLSILLTAFIAGLVWLPDVLNQGLRGFNVHGLAWFAAGGALTIFIGRVFFHASIQYLGAVRGSSVKRLAPFFSVLMGVLVLGEPLGLALVLGMLLIFAGFALLVYESRSAPGATGTAAESERKSTGIERWVNAGIVYGAVSAFAYAAGNVARKYGLIYMPEPAFGAMLGSIVGAFLFLMTASVVDSYRHAVHMTFTRFNPWLFAAGVLASAGQLLFFAAIDRSTISRAALIVSIEVFVTIFLTVVVFQGREKMTLSALVAAALGVTGTIVIIAGSGF